MEPTTIKDFEAAIAELESIVKKLEEGDLALEASLQLYERGVQLSRFCHSRLEDAERRIEILNERGQLRPAAGATSTPTTTRRRARDDRRDSRRRVRARAAGRSRGRARDPAAAAARLPRSRGRRDALQPDGRRQAAAAGAVPGQRRGRRRPDRRGPASRLRDRADSHLLAHPRRSAGDGRRLDAPRPADAARRRRRRAWPSWRATACSPKRSTCSSSLPGRCRARVLRAVRSIAEAAGPVGMVGGQAIDLASRDARSRRAARAGARRRRPRHACTRRRPARSSARPPRRAPCSAAAAKRRSPAIDAAAAEFGLAFQIVDDILDVEGDAGAARQDAGQGRRRRQAHLSCAVRARPVPTDGGSLHRSRGRRARGRGHGRLVAARHRPLDCGAPELDVSRWAGGVRPPGYD